MLRAHLCKCRVAVEALLHAVGAALQQAKALPHVRVMRARASVACAAAAYTL